MCLFSQHFIAQHFPLCCFSCWDNLSRFFFMCCRTISRHQHIFSKLYFQLGQSCCITNVKTCFKFHQCFLTITRLPTDTLHGLPFSIPPHPPHHPWRKIKGSGWGWGWLVRIIVHNIPFLSKEIFLPGVGVCVWKGEHAKTFETRFLLGEISVEHFHKHSWGQAPISN